MRFITMTPWLAEATRRRAINMLARCMLANEALMRASWLMRESCVEQDKEQSSLQVDILSCGNGSPVMGQGIPDLGAGCGKALPRQPATAVTRLTGA